MNRSLLKIQRKVGKCKRCGSVALFTNDFHQGNRIYKCIVCGALTASPTTYAWCSRIGLISKDTFGNDCDFCDIRKAENINLKERRCPYFTERVYLDTYRK